MDQTHTSSTAPVSRTFVLYVSHVLLLFSSVLTVVLFFSWLILLPRFTQFAVGDRLMTPRAMAMREETLRAELLDMEKTRIRLVLPYQDDTFSALKQEKFSQPSLAHVRLALKQAIARAEATDAIVLQLIQFDAASGSVQVRGDVRGVGMSSMTVLAAFMGEVERIPFLNITEHPSFSRVSDAVIGVHSPFHFSCTFERPSL